MRKPMITRTMNTMTVTAMVVNTVTAEVENRTIELGRAIKDDKKLEKAVKVAVEVEEGIKFVAVVDKKAGTAIYGMSEDDFIKHAVLLDENRKIVSVPEDEE